MTKTEELNETELDSVTGGKRKLVAAQFQTTSAAATSSGIWHINEDEGGLVSSGSANEKVSFNFSKIKF
ncbi:MAG: bacteriocin [Pseudomonadota bacterium]